MLRPDESEIGDNAFRQELVDGIAHDACTKLRNLLDIVEGKLDRFIDRKGRVVSRGCRRNNADFGAVACIDLCDGRTKIGKPAYADEIRGARHKRSPHAVKFQLGDKIWRGPLQAGLTGVSTKKKGGLSRP
jgi:hypothetical protein